MCSECYCTPCLAGCPNAPEPEVVATCCQCDEEFHVEDEYFEFCDSVFCEDCLSKLTLNDLSDYMGLGISEIIYELGGERKIGEID